jgi:hypothetical protein
MQQLFLSVDHYRTMHTSMRATLFAALLTFALTAAASDGRLDVVVSAVSAQNGEGWLAMVRADAPHSEPSFEQRVTPGRRVTAGLPEGRYYASLATVGGDVEIRPVTIVADRTTSLEFIPQPSPGYSGRVYDEQGAPLAGATVAQLRAVLHPFVGFFSADALAALADGWSTTTGEDGAWTLPGSSRERIPCVVSKSGKTPVVVELAPSAPPADVMLLDGRELRLKIDRPDSGAILHLVPLDRNRLQPELGRWLERYSTRDANKVVQWDALPPGRYIVVEEHRAKPGSRRELVTVDLTERSTEIAHSRTDDAAGVPRIAAAYVPEKRITGDDQPRLFVDGVAQPHRLRSTPGGTRVEWASTRPSSDVHLTTASHLFLGDGAGDVPRLDAFTRAGLSAQLLLPPGGSPVEQLEVFFGVCGGGRRPAYRLRPTANRVDLAVPSACGSMQLAPSPYRLHTIQYRLASGETRDLGELRLVSGAPLVVQTVAADPRAPLPGRVITATSVDNDVPEVVGRATTSADGSARLTGLPLNQRLIVEAVDPVTNSRGRTELLAGIAGQASARIELLPPATLRLKVRLSPSFLTIDPKATIEELTLLPALNMSEPPLKMRMSGPEASVDGVPPGIWVASALVRAGNGALYPIRVGELHVEASQNVERELEIEPLVFHGRVSRRGAPVRGDLSLGDAKQPGAMRRIVRLADDGSFSLLLPATGVYDVEVTPRTERKIRLGWFGFEDPARPVTIAIPSGVIRCLVVSASGQPQPGKAVVLKQLATGTAPTVRGGRTGPTGEATIDNLAPGEWTATVQGVDGVEERVTLREDEPAAVVLRVP